MPTAEHESPIQIIRDNPAIIAQVMRAAFDIEISDDVEVRTASEDFTQIAPTAYRADNVVEICERGSPERKIGVVAETQRAVDPKKRHSWPLYLTGLFARLECPSYLVVICPGGRVAQWAREPIDIGHPGFTLAPLVLGPGTGPLVTSTDQAAQMPELAVIAALANVTPPTEESLEITYAALATIENTQQENGHLYTDMVHKVLPLAAKKILEEFVTTGTADYKFTSDFALRNHERGREEGREEGIALGEAKSVLVILAARKLVVSDEARERIMSCQDLDTLEGWVNRALTVESVEALFE
ncbi:hypothetical protein [Actinomadura terrae]|uniref:hypothetical protein n=1 Tax=Actinomadura terrae TaxID=604353 RepID=UPI001FA7B505|nr:hypothetical protein [Actinomadura terrae]